jgi:hypothetical protein
LKAEPWALTTLVSSVPNETEKRAAIPFYPGDPGITNKLQGIFKHHNIDLVYSNMETRRINVTHWRNQVSSKLHVKVVKRNTSARQKDVPSQDLRSMSDTFGGGCSVGSSDED